MDQWADRRTDRNNSKTHIGVQVRSQNTPRDVRHARLRHRAEEKVGRGGRGTYVRLT